jgi:hypothetical protein
VAYETGFIETGRRNCDHCGKEMAAWKDMRPPIYVLSKRPVKVARLDMGVAF